MQRFRSNTSHILNQSIRSGNTARRRGAIDASAMEVHATAAAQAVASVGGCTNPQNNKRRKSSPSEPEMQPLNGEEARLDKKRAQEANAPQEKAEEAKAQQKAEEAKRVRRSLEMEEHVHMVCARESGLRQRYLRLIQQEMKMVSKPNMTPKAAAKQ